MSDKNNILLSKWETPFGIPPFDKIKPEDFIPGIIEAIDETRKEIQLIIQSESEPTFKNTIVALEESGKRLNIIAATLFNLNSSETNEEIQEAVQKASKLLTAFANDITLDKKLFAKVKEVYNSGIIKNLNSEDRNLLEEKYRGFR